MKQGKQSGSSHLRNGIAYILNEEKTRKGLLVDSNCGTGAAEIFVRMMETKKEYGKTDGRQGYHFILSFLPGEGDAETVYRIGSEFAEKYLQNRYDYVTAVHEDQEHLHIHLIFNSVSYDGYKYHYANGDWEKEIQPLTNHLAKKYGFSEILLENLSQTRKKEGTIREQLKKDLDTGVEKVQSFSGLLEYLKIRGYEVRIGTSSKEGEYLSIRPVGRKAIRSYRLGWQYHPDMLRKRIRMNRREWKSPAVRQVRFPTSFRSSSLYQLNHFKRYRDAARNIYWHPGFTGRSELMKLWENCSYLYRNQIRSREILKDRIQELELYEKELYGKKDRILTGAEQQILSGYRNLKRELEQEKNPELRELLIEELEELEQKEPVQELLEQEKRMKEAELQLQVVKMEKRVARRIRDLDTGTEKILETERKKEKNYGHRKV